MRNPQEEPYIEALRKKIWTTRGSRYNACRRLLKTHSLSFKLMTYLSAFVLILNVVGRLKPEVFGAYQEPVVSFGTIAVSIFILVIGLLEHSKSHVMNAHAFQECGNELSKVYDRICQIRDYVAVDSPEFLPSVKNAASDYETVIQRYSINHEPLDYNLFRAQNRTEFGLNWAHAVLYRIRWWFHLYAYCGFLVLPLAFLVFLTAITNR